MRMFLVLASGIAGAMAAGPAAPQYVQQFPTTASGQAQALSKNEQLFSGPIIPVNLGSVSTINIPVIGDIGRSGGLQSINNGNPGCPTLTGSGAPGNYFGFQASVMNSHNNFAGSQNTDDDILGAWQQHRTAKLLDGVCAGLSGGCQAVFNTGDNFYQCGVDDQFNPNGYPYHSTNPNNTRLYNDWYSVYQTASTPSIKGLPWFSVLGNHDLPTPGGVDIQINYDILGKQAQGVYPYGANWNLPARYYAADFYTSSGSSGPSVRLIALNTNPCNAQYNTAVKKFQYGLSEELTRTGTEQYVAAMLDWLNQTLISSSTTGCNGNGCKYTVVMSHYGLYSSDASMGAMNSADPTYVGGEGTAAGPFDSGNLGRFNCFGQIQNIFMQNNGKYAPDAWLNGHDHANGILMNPDYSTPNGPDTIFVLSGSGSLMQAGDGMPLSKSGNLTGSFPSIPGSQGLYPYHVLFTSTSADGSIANSGVSVLKITNAAFTVDTYVTENGADLLAGGGAPCEIAATLQNNGVDVWANDGSYNWTAVTANWQSNNGAFGSTGLSCNLCMNTTMNAVCGTPLSTYGISYTGSATAYPSGYMSYGSSSNLLTATNPPGTVVLAHSCSSTDRKTASCTCKRSGYPASGFQTTGSGFAICQTVNSFATGLASSYSGFTMAPAGIQGPEKSTWWQVGSFAVKGARPLLTPAPAPPPPLKTLPTSGANAATLSSLVAMFVLVLVTLL